MYGYGHLGNWFMKSTIRGSYTENFQENKAVSRKSSSLFDGSIFYSPFFVLTLAFQREVLYGFVTFSMVVLLNKKPCSSFSKYLFVSQKTFLKVRVMKTFKVSSGCHIKVCQSPKRGSISKIPSSCFLEEPMLFLLL